jgi:hypothetical protein
LVFAKQKKCNVYAIMPFIIILFPIPFIRIT